MYNTDKPITLAKEDKLMRLKFADELANAILLHTSNDNLTISLTGKWGCGKTSILNMVKNKIEQLTEEKSNETRPILVEFNPWNYSNQDHLITEFFKTIETSLKTSKNPVNMQDLITALSQYATLLQFVMLYSDIPTVKYKIANFFVSKFWKIYIKAQEKKPDLITQKKVIIDMLEKQQQKIIVVIDDIDRLNNKQIRQIFQLVNAVAGFPNIIYLMSFDKSIVTRALAEEQNCNGEEYLEKIIQLPFDVPPINRTKLMSVFTNRFSSIVQEKIYDDVHLDYWYKILDSCISPFINSIRDINRILNVYEFKYNLLKEETNYADLIAITTLQVQYPKIYEWIANNKYRLTGISTSKKTTDEQKDKIRADYLLAWGEIYPDCQHKVMESLKILFPKITQLSSGSYISLTTEDVMRYQQNLASPERFDLYFNLSLEEIKFTRDYMKNTLHNLDNEALSRQLDLLTETGTLDEYLIELQGYFKEISGSRIYLFLNEMIRLQTIEKNNQKKDLFTSPPSRRCHDCSILLLEKLDETKRYNYLIQSINSSNCYTLPVLCKILTFIEMSTGKFSSAVFIEPLLSSSKYVTDIEHAFLEKMKHIYSEVNILDSPYFSHLNKLWVLLEKETFYMHIKELLKNPINTPKFLFHATMRWSNDVDWGYSFEEEDFSVFISKEEACKQIYSLKGTKEFEALAYDFKKTAIAFYLWCNINSKDTKGVSEKEVKNLLPEWEQIR